MFSFQMKKFIRNKNFKIHFFFNVLEVWDADQLFWFFRLPFSSWWFHSQRFVRCNLLSSVRTEASENERYRYNNQVENDKLIQKFEYLKNSLHANLNPDYWWNIFEFISVFCSKSFNFSSRIQTRFIFQDCMAVKLWKNFLGLVSVDVHEFTRKWWYFFFRLLDKWKRSSLTVDWTHWNILDMKAMNTKWKLWIPRMKRFIKNSDQQTLDVWPSQKWWVFIVPSE